VAHATHEDFAALLQRNERVRHDGLVELLVRGARAGQVDRELDPVAVAKWIPALVDSLFLRAGDPGFDADAERRMLRVILRRLRRAPER
jgi:hypothetical protein